ncbi:hypothetical protein NPIL_328341 [Nephila pilipes]|uniref:Uncharacterized protein n=1 Tax=Nephila pilipes TaxID=299642 RepID=A0A8X6NU14_NEPPI|nr:hypothetical protein NPIL_328341 [Nephila pilipes]
MSSLSNVSDRSDPVRIPIQRLLSQNCINVTFSMACFSPYKTVHFLIFIITFNRWYGKFLPMYGESAVVYQKLGPFIHLISAQTTSCYGIPIGLSFWRTTRNLDTSEILHFSACYGN